ncbi:MAG: carotenoid biosynthesis protein [Bacteroidales bacterium]|nr:carotenoid biosynthesis protein [Bacteroidales bacterium]
MNTLKNILISQFTDNPVRTKKYKSFFVWFYAIGLAGVVLPYTNALFLKLTPLALIISVFAILAFHRFKPVKKTIVVFFAIYFIGFFIEVAGVKTGLIFGVYNYGSTLGLKVFDTPLIIGINWLLLVYLSANLIEKLKLNAVLTIIAASLVMLAYDLLMEQVAPVTGMWYWKDNTVPIMNYMAWFFVALILHTIFRWSGIKAENKIAPVIFFSQLVFFLGIFIRFILTK